MKNLEIAQLFKDMGTLLEIKGDNIFKIKAYYKASDTIKSLSEDLEQIRREERLSKIPGVGQAIQEKIGEYLDGGKVAAYEKLKEEIPVTLLDIVRIPSLGPKKAKLFYDELKVTNLKQLQRCAKDGKLLELPGIQEKTIANILKGIDIVREGQERMNLGAATKVAESMIEVLSALKEVKHISIAGSLRRSRETIGDLDILIDATDSAKVMDAFVNLENVTSITAHGETKSSVRVENNTQVDLRIVDKSSFGAALLYFTGSKNFNIKLRQIAQKQNKKVNEYGVFAVKGKTEKLIASKTEQECFKALNIEYIPPELREDIGMENLFKGDSPHSGTVPKLVEQKDIKGDLHMHSTWSDGKNSIEEMVQAAIARGYEYIAITDHSYALRIANGVSPTDLIKKKKEIDKLNKKYKDITILMGSEVEIDKNGDLDYNDEILSSMDVVIGAIHTGFEQSPEQLTNRLLRAIGNKHVNFIAHPTGIHIGKRKSYEFDFKKVCQAAVDHNVYLEINAFPIRLDLNSNNAYYARQQGVNLVINTDSHHVNHLNHMRFGVGLARRAWVTKQGVLNTKSLKALLKVLNK